MPSLKYIDSNNSGSGTRVEGKDRRGAEGGCFWELRRSLLAERGLGFIIIILYKNSPLKCCVSRTRKSTG